MGRRHRPHLPGATFHLTTRLQNREALFSPELRTRLVTLLREHVVFSDVELFAYCIMPNHVHLVLRQGDASLGRFMQAFLRRAALLVQRSHRRDGHVFERRYRDNACLDPDYFRNAIVYTHLNPVRAGFCDDAAEYEWSSCGAWIEHDIAADGKPHPVSLERPLSTFALGAERTRAELSQDYLAFQGWREAYDQAVAEAETSGAPGLLPRGPDPMHGDVNWARYLAMPKDDPAPEGTGRVNTPGLWARPRPDLTTIAHTVLATKSPPLDARLVRSRWGGPAYVGARRSIIHQAVAAGYNGQEIARFLRVSTSAVSAAITAERKRLLDPVD